MKKLLVILVISCILLTQCYTQNEYLTKDYVFSPETDLKKVELTDGTEREFSFTQFNYKIESDSLLIMFMARKEIVDNQIQFVSVMDTLILEEIRSLVVSEYASGATTVLIIFAGLLLLSFLYLESSGLGNDMTSGF